MIPKIRGEGGILGFSRLPEMEMVTTQREPNHYPITR
jgi:hypothetical protein